METKESTNDYTLLAPGDDGKWHVVYESNVLFESKEEREDFEEWLKGPGSEQFAEFREKRHDDGL